MTCVCWCYVAYVCCCYISILQKYNWFVKVVIVGTHLVIVDMQWVMVHIHLVIVDTHYGSFRIHLVIVELERACVYRRKSFRKHIKDLNILQRGIVVVVWI